VNRSKWFVVSVSRSKRHQRQLIYPLVFFFLFLDVATHRDFVPPWLHRAPCRQPARRLINHEALSSSSTFATVHQVFALG
jgi:hypothetical protein